MVPGDNQEINERLLKFKEELKLDKSEADFGQLEQIIKDCNELAINRHFQLILPLSLQLLDHHHVPYKIHGISCVTHIVQALSLNDLKARGADGLLLHSLKQLLFSNDAELFEYLLPSLLKVMKTLKLDPLNLDDSRTDDIFDQLLINVQSATALPAKQVLWKNLKAFVEFLDLAVVKYTKRLVTLIEVELSYPLRRENEDVFIDLFISVDNFLKQSQGPANYVAGMFEATFKFIQTNFDQLKNSSRLKDQIHVVLKHLRLKDEKLYAKLFEITSEVVGDQPSLQLLSAR